MMDFRTGGTSQKLKRFLRDLRHAVCWVLDVLMPMPQGTRLSLSRAHLKSREPSSARGAPRHAMAATPRGGTPQFLSESQCQQF